MRIDFSQLNAHLSHHVPKRFRANTSFLAVAAKFTQITLLTEDAEGEKEESLRPTLPETREANQHQRACPGHCLPTRIKGLCDLISVVTK